MTMRDQISDAQRQDMVLHFIAALLTSGVPKHLHGGLVRYFGEGILPGSFLQSVLTNNLTQAVLRQDVESMVELASIVRFLVAHAPAPAWGSREAVLAWSTTPERLEI